jgi:molybdopterin synthase catalytic subunit
MKILVQEADFDPGAEMDALGCGNPDVGGVAVFVGRVRDANVSERVFAMTLEHYPAMTEKALGAIMDQAQKRWTILDATIIHRVGRLRPLDHIVFVGVAAAHRGDAFAACEFLMDYLKTRAPFWKREETATGSRWVEARSTDDVAAARWEMPGDNRTFPASGQSRFTGTVEDPDC